MTDRDDTVSGSLKTGADAGSLPEGLYITLEVIEGPDQGLKYGIKSTRTTLGRKAADVVLNDPTVSSVHAVIEFVGSKLFLTDNNSTNGTHLNGERVESAPLGNLDEIQLGDTTLLLSVVEDKYGAFAEPAAEDTSESRVGMDESTIVTGALPNPEIPPNLQVVLDVTHGPDQGKVFKLDHKSTVIGRGFGADVRLTDPSVSKRHCQVEVHNKDKMTIKDLASANGTRLNDHYISAVKIRHGDVVHLGETVIKILINIRR
ncbi:MAG TPA: FHA domain-containing protein [bacterium]|nr:FHA domain-containing protein [bacterium]